MATKAKPAENPLDAAMSFVAQRKPVEPVVPPAETLAAVPEPTMPEPTAQAEPTPAAEIEQPVDNQQPKGKKDSVKDPAKDPIPAASASNADYAGFFLRPVRGRKPKTIYISEDMHTALATITQASPDNVGLSDLLMNIVNHHFETFGPGIRQFLTAQEKLRKTKLPY